MDKLYARKMTLNCKNYRRKESKTRKLKKKRKDIQENINEID